MKKSIVIAGLLALCAGPALAQSEAENPVPTGGKKASEILAIVEARPDFGMLEEMSWDDDGYYEIEYRTSDKARVEINLDSSGQPVERR